MECFTLTYPAKASLARPALAGVVGSGDLQAIYQPENDNQLTICIKTSVNGSQVLWKKLFEHLINNRTIPAGKLHINDFAATPGVALLRIEQVFEEAAHVA